LMHNRLVDIRQIWNDHQFVQSRRICSWTLSTSQGSVRNHTGIESKSIAGWRLKTDWSIWKRLIDIAIKTARTISSLILFTSICVL
jgi:hypothetical protein